jgi:hypothetical protein
VALTDSLANQSLTNLYSSTPSSSSLAIPLMPRTIICSALLLFVGALTVGCGGASKTAPVTGRVTYKGKPVPNANVSFSPVDSGGRPATGITDSGGRFTLGTVSTNDGALIGKYQVSIIARGPDRTPKPGESLSGMPGEMMPGDPIIPTKYFAPDTSGLTHEVKRGSNRVDLELKD